MELKLTFEDGSEGLTHYGVKGMKWGHRKNKYDPDSEYWQELEYNSRKNDFSPGSSQARTPFQIAQTRINEGARRAKKDASMRRVVGGLKERLSGYPNSGLVSKGSRRVSRLLKTVKAFRGA